MDQCIPVHADTFDTGAAYPGVAKGKTAGCATIGTVLILQSTYFVLQLQHHLHQLIFVNGKLNGIDACA